jgi:hypothetical protein
MVEQPIHLLDAHHQVVATAQVKRQGDRYLGTVNVANMPPELRALFEKYENLVNDQVFSLLDQVEEKIEATGFTVAFDNGDETAVTELQLYPKNGSIAFKTSTAAVPALQK